MTPMPNTASKPMRTVHSPPPEPLPRRSLEGFADAWVRYAVVHNDDEHRYVLALIRRDMGLLKAAPTVPDATPATLAALRRQAATLVRLGTAGRL